MGEVRKQRLFNPLRPSYYLQSTHFYTDRFQGSYYTLYTFTQLPLPRIYILRSFYNNLLLCSYDILFDKSLHFTTIITSLPILDYCYIHIQRINALPSYVGHGCGVM